MQENRQNNTPHNLLIIKEPGLSKLLTEGSVQDFTITRVKRTNTGGGAAKPEKSPLAWAIYFSVGETRAVLTSSRGRRREWQDNNLVIKWLRNRNIQNWRGVNELESCELSPS